jgi:hypothetical protein
MKTPESFVLSHEQRDEIMKAVAAIGRQIGEIGSKPNQQIVWVIHTNLAIIQTHVSSLPRFGSN